MTRGDPAPHPGPGHPMGDVMKTIVILPAALLAAACAHNGGPHSTTPAQSAKDEADLAKELSGRVAGPPQDCVNLDQLGGNRAYGRDVIVFSGLTNEVVWVNRPPNGCLYLDPGRALLVKPTMGRLCRGDAVTVVDPTSGTEFAGCGLGQFTPYRLAH
jgi:hypothetical protein